MASWLVAILAWVPGALFAQDGLTRPVDLRQEAALMRREKRPMLVLFSQANCSYCEKARAHYLGPMSRDAHWQGRALFRQIDLDSDAPLVGFDGTAQTHRGFAKAAGVSVTPTVVVFGPDGQALAPAIVGVSLPDFYGQYLEQAIEQARAAMAP
ncbi:thioredoxin fold domain-containing protein [Nitrogeniibacter mangrovi]|uniref:Thioredoxin fold domain-containing protein n=1 Tax=Nitrogeniibacter mangrovi TaxID=2016596 RepID=A0A6C1B2S4_9RHOO|nr:thioredoxin fold domain-containing protein [Nitrogeniibacter mangrovi]QID17138.1 thioredoxin fold domain-containing protein [Nitrogeniibacter mangrovi]